MPLPMHPTGSTGAAMIEVHVSDADALCRAAQQQLPFAISKAINATANNVRDTMRDELLMRFMVRRKPFIRSNVQVKKYSDKKEPTIYAEIGTGHPDGSDLLAKFERGGTKVMKSALNPVIIPSTNIKRTPMSIPATEMYPHMLGLVQQRATIGVRKLRTHRTRTGKIQIKGVRRTFVIGEPGAKVWGVFQRTSKKKIRLLWTYKQSVPITARLGFVKTAVAVVEARWPANFDAAFAQAIATAR